ncbi:MAG: (Fe-S)-binding protein, partial [Myxococcales bacterium]|nr:(Fe-S)-binding protein [Myxococcales bacterium]
GKLAWTRENTEALWACTGCRACTTYCEHENEPALVLLSGRSRANAEGACHTALEKYPERFRTRDARLAEKLREHVSKTKRGDEALVGFWPGCDAVDKGMQDLEAALQVFATLGGEPVVVVESEQVCGGYPLLAAGYPDMFRWHAEKVAKSMAKFKTIITNCSACLFTVQRQYAAEGIDLDIDIISVPEFLATMIQALPKARRKEPVYYHDPCHLA